MNRQMFTLMICCSLSGVAIITGVGGCSLFCLGNPKSQRLERLLAAIAHSLDESLEQMAVLRNTI